MSSYRLLAAVCLLTASCPVFASGFERPVPLPRSATVELWFALASLMLCIALYAVHRVVKRR